MTDLQIRTEEPQDITAIRDVTAAAFATSEHSDGSEPRIVDALRQAGALELSLIAFEAETLVGHIAFSTVLIDGRRQGWFGLGPLSVSPSRHKVGIGSQLVREGLKRLQSRGASGCVVLGDPAYYCRFGFVCDANLTFDGAPPEYFMRLDFSDGSPKGAVTYHTAFFVN